MPARFRLVFTVLTSPLGVTITPRKAEKTVWIPTSVASLQSREAADWLHAPSWRAGTADSKGNKNDPSRRIFDRARLSPVVPLPGLTTWAQKAPDHCAC
jgi:hypothetical protein